MNSTLIVGKRKQNPTLTKTAHTHQLTRPFSFIFTACALPPPLPSPDPSCSPPPPCRQLRHFHNVDGDSFAVTNSQSSWLSSPSIHSTNCWGVVQQPQLDVFSPAPRSSRFRQPHILQTAGGDPYVCHGPSEQRFLHIAEPPWPFPERPAPPRTPCQTADRSRQGVCRLSLTSHTESRGSRVLSQFCGSSPRPYRSPVSDCKSFSGCPSSQSRMFWSSQRSSGTMFRNCP